MPKKSAAKKRASADRSPELPDFEELLAELEQTVMHLEDGQLGLAEALEKYERGVQCLKLCYELLQTAEQKIELLSRIDDQGNVRVVPFQAEEDA